MTDIANIKLRRIKGDWIQDGYIDDLAPRYIYVNLHADGSIYDPETNEELIAEKWGDGEYITNGIWQFSPDKGEFNRIKCKIELKGSAAGLPHPKGDQK